MNPPPARCLTCRNLAAECCISVASVSAICIVTDVTQPAEQVSSQHRCCLRHTAMSCMPRLQHAHVIWKAMAHAHVSIIITKTLKYSMRHRLICQTRQRLTGSNGCSGCSIQTHIPSLLRCRIAALPHAQHIQPPATTPHALQQHPT
jgi:hypothetical protein